jgi:hypothetical protein
MAGIFPALLFPSDRARFLGSFVQWGPSVIAIVAALLVAAGTVSADGHTLTLLYGDEGPGSDQIRATFRR